MNRRHLAETAMDSLNAGDVVINFTDCRSWIPAEYIAPHRHDDLYQIDLFHGEGATTLNNERTAIRRWALVFIPPGTMHDFTAGTTGHFRNIGIKAAVACPAARAIPPFVLTADSGDRFEPIQRDLQSILHEWQVQRLGSQRLMQIRCVSLLLQSLRLWVDDENQAPSHDIVQEACHMLALRYSEPLTIDQLARHCGIRPESLCRAFRRVMGEPPRRYLTRLRLRQAAALLETGVTATEAARQTGFQSIHYFSRTFHRFMGQSPRNWLAHRREHAT